MVPSGEMHLPSGKTIVCPLMFLAPQVEGKMLLLNPQKGAWNAGVGRSIQGSQGSSTATVWPGLVSYSKVRRLRQISPAVSSGLGGLSLQPQPRLTQLCDPCIGYTFGRDLALVHLFSQV